MSSYCGIHFGALSIFDEKSFVPEEGLRGHCKLSPNFRCVYVEVGEKGMEIYESDLVRIPYEDFLKLLSEGKVSLGIGKSEAELISQSPDLKPTKTTAAAAFKFWNVIAVLGLLYTIYLSFTDSWWWFLIGALAAGVVVRANQSANQTNLLDAAMVDREFYEKIARMGGWHYRMALEDAEPYFTAEFREGREAAAQHIAAMRALADR